MPDGLIKVFGWKAGIYQSDPTSYTRYRWLKEHLKPGPVRTLDAGCGSGTYSLLAASLGNEVIGLTDSEGDAEKARARARLCALDAKFEILDLRQLDKHDLEPADQIIACEIIEHIINDRKLVKDLAAKLKPGGQLLLTTPYLHHHPYYGEWRMQTPGVECSAGHVRFGYTHQEIKEMFRGGGLELVCESYMAGFVSIQITNLFLILSKLNVYGAWAATFPLRALQAIDEPVTRLLKYPHLTLGAVGVKV